MNQQPAEPLTKREMDVARLIADAQTDNQIAYRLHLSPLSVRFHIDNILSKLGLPNRVAICKWWYQKEIQKLKEQIA
jgi:DNA-binding CsgD family transcriptional regulator